MSISIKGLINDLGPRSGRMLGHISEIGAGEGATESELEPLTDPIKAVTLLEASDHPSKDQIANQEAQFRSAFIARMDGNPSLRMKALRRALHAVELANKQEEARLSENTRAGITGRESRASQNQVQIEAQYQSYIESMGLSVVEIFEPSDSMAATNGFVNIAYNHRYAIAINEGARFQSFLESLAPGDLQDADRNTLQGLANRFQMQILQQGLKTNLHEDETQQLFDGVLRSYSNFDGIISSFRKLGVNADDLEQAFDSMKNGTMEKFFKASLTLLLDIDSDTFNSSRWHCDPGGEEGYQKRIDEMLNDMRSLKVEPSMKVLFERAMQVQVANLNHAVAEMEAFLEGRYIGEMKKLQENEILEPGGYSDTLYKELFPELVKKAKSALEQLTNL